MADQYEFDIGLEEGGEESAYRISNLVNQEQRPNLVQREYRSDRILKGKLQHVIHGNLCPGGDKATLIVANFQFLGQTVDRRFRKARIKWDFAYADSSEEAPEVLKVSLDGQYIMNESVVSITKEVHAESGIQGGVGVTGHVGTGWTRCQGAEMKDHISMFGTSIFTRQQCGEPNGAQWVLDENASQRSGIPGAITTAMLLRRDPDRVFTGTIEVKAEVSKVNKVEDWFGRKPRVDPVRFNPALPPTSMVYDAQNLDAVDMEAIAKVVLYTSLPVVQ